jgi:hypothetical protein
MVLEHRQEDNVWLLDGQRGVDAIDKGLHGLADRRGPLAIDVAVVAADTLELLLYPPREPKAVGREVRGGLDNGHPP